MLRLHFLMPSYVFSFTFSSRLSIFKNFVMLFIFYTVLLLCIAGRCFLHISFEILCFVVIRFRVFVQFGLNVVLANAVPLSVFFFEMLVLYLVPAFSSDRSCICKCSKGFNVCDEW